MSILPRAVDERFLAHRQQSTSVGGIIAAVLALSLFLYRHYADGAWNWDLLAVGATFVAVKFALMTWYYLTD
jgi:hypothetical protein